MTAFERRQRILRILQQQPGVRVTELAKTLDVTEATVRTDLSRLEAEEKVRRVRGGAVLTDLIVNGGRASTAPEEKAAKWIGRWAADRVEDGDTILLDSSTLAFSLTPFLTERRRLTVVTNSLGAAQALTAGSTHTVILLGGVMRSDGYATTGLLGAPMLRDLHFRLAFLSGAGFTADIGLMDDDLQEAQLRRLMLELADSVVALVDASHLGRKGLTQVAAVERIHHLFTDTGASAEQLDMLRRLPLQLTVCGENTVTNITSHRAQDIYKIGFANLSEEIPFAVDVRRGLERAAKQRSNVDLVIADNRLSSERALAIADNFVAKGVQVAIEYQIDARMGTTIMNKYQRARIPVIAVDIPMVGATYFGVDNFYSGHLAGVALGRWIEQNWQGNVDALLILEEPRAGALPEARIEGQVAGLREVLGEEFAAQRRVLNSGNTSAASEVVVAQALVDLSGCQRIAVACFNDDAALGALRAARRLGREQDLAIVGQGADRLVQHELRQPGARIIGSTAFMPERYGNLLIDLALRILRGESVPPAVYVEHVFIDAHNVDHFYPSP